MINEERYIRNKFGNANHFSVPEGYFDNFTSQLMDKLPEREDDGIPMRHSRLKILRPLLYAAACLCVAVFGATIYFSQAESASDGQSETSAVLSQGVYNVYNDIDEDYVVDYAMMDNVEIYAYLSGE